MKKTSANGMKKQTSELLLLTSVFLAGAAFFISSPLTTAQEASRYAPSNPDADPDPEFDRLDGKGPSGKKVDVVEWEGNLEIHVYPKGSLAGLALKLDDKNKSKPVMVIGYRFTNNTKKQLIRRAIIGVPFTAQFKAFQVTKEPDFDKVIISNAALSGELAEYKLDPAPTQLYPNDPKPKTSVAQGETRSQATHENESPRAPSSESEKKTTDENGTIAPFKW